MVVVVPPSLEPLPPSSGETAVTVDPLPESESPLPVPEPELPEPELSPDPELPLDPELPPEPEPEPEPELLVLVPDTSPLWSSLPEPLLRVVALPELEPSDPPPEVEPPPELVP